MNDKEHIDRLMQICNAFVHGAKNMEGEALEYDRNQYEKGYTDARERYKRPSGEWIVTERGYECSKCGALHRDDYPFCHMCGADMRKDNRLTKEQLENVWDSGYVKSEVEDWYEEGD